MILRKKNFLSSNQNSTCEPRIMLAATTTGPSTDDITIDNGEGAKFGAVVVGKTTYVNKTSKEGRRTADESSFEVRSKQTSQLGQNEFDAMLDRAEVEAARKGKRVSKKQFQDIIDRTTAKEVEFQRGELYKGKNDGSGKYTRFRSDGKPSKQKLNLGKSVGEESILMAKTSKRLGKEVGVRVDADKKVDTKTRSVGEKDAVLIKGEPKPGGGTIHTHPDDSDKFRDANGK